MAFDKAVFSDTKLPCYQSGYQSGYQNQIHLFRNFCSHCNTLGISMLRTVLLVALTMPILFAGCRTQTRTVTGTLTIVSNGRRAIDQVAASGIKERCSYSDLSRAYSDIYEGVQIALKDASGKLIAKGELQGGLVVNLNGIGGCEFLFVIPGVPDTDFYTVDIGTRVGVTYSLKEIQEQNWHLKIWL